MQDIVFLQEVFMEEDVSQLIGAAKHGRLKHSLFYNAGMLHGELLLVTAYPITEVPLSETLHALKVCASFCLPCQTVFMPHQSCDSMNRICRHIFMGMLLLAIPLR